MPRQLKPQPVGDLITDRDTGDSIQIYLDRNSKDFFFEYQGETTRSVKYDELPFKAKQIMVDAHNLDWQAVIHITQERRGKWAYQVFGADCQLPLQTLSVGVSQRW